MQGMDKEIAANYGLDVKNIAPYKDAYMVQTDKGRKILKKMQLSPERILFIHGAKEHLVSNGFSGVDRYHVTHKGFPCFIFDNTSYVLYDLPDGHECNFDNDDEVLRSARMLADMHSASAGYIPPEGSKIQDDLGMLPVYFNKRLEDIKKLRKVAKKGKSSFDHLFLEYADYFINMGEDALIQLNGSNYSKLVEDTREKGTFCHHDFTHHNIFLSDNGLSLTNFEYCCFELKIYDVANLIRRKMRKCRWEMDKAKMILEAYSEVEPLSMDELAVMKTILQFPQKFWRVVNRYYNSRRSWSEKSFVAKLREVLDEADDHRIFINNYSF